MRKGTDLINKPIVAFDTGEINGRVKDLLFDQNQNILMAVLVEDSKFLRSATVLPLASVQSIGADAIITATKDNVISVSNVPNIQAVLERNNVLKGTHIMTVDGRDLGKMIDLYFDELTGLIEGYEVSGGMFADAYSGRSFVPAVQTLKIGEHFAFVPAIVATLMEEQVGGIKAAVLTASDKLKTVSQQTVEQVKENAQVAGDKLQQVSQVAGEKLQQVTQQAGEKVAETQDELTTYMGNVVSQANEAVAAYTVEQALGRRVQQVVKTRDGIIVAAPGQIVTDVVIARAKAYHQEQALLNAVGLSTTQAIRQGADGAIAQAGTTTNNIGHQATHAWGWVKESVDDLRGRSTQVIEDQRIRGALGRPVTRVILDKQDRVLLNVGEFITHEAIETARQADALDILLSSVYTQTPEFSNSELRAPESGRAALKSMR